MSEITPQRFAELATLARTDLLDLADRGVLELKKKGKELVFRVPADIGQRLERLSGSDE